ARQHRASKRARAAAGVPVGIAFVVGGGHLAPACSSARREDQAGDDYGTTEYFVHRLPPEDEHWRYEQDSMRRLIGTPTAGRKAWGSFLPRCLVAPQECALWRASRATRFSLPACLFIGRRHPQCK